MRRLFSKDENIAILEMGVVGILAVLIFIGGFITGQIFSIGNFLIWVFGG